MDVGRLNRKRPTDRYIISRCQLPCINLYEPGFGFIFQWLTVGSRAVGIAWRGSRLKRGWIRRNPRRPVTSNRVRKARNCKKTYIRSTVPARPRNDFASHAEIFRSKFQPRSDAPRQFFTWLVPLVRDTRCTVLVKNIMHRAGTSIYRHYHNWSHTLNRNNFFANSIFLKFSVHALY